jgi:hypothetical protein
MASRAEALHLLWATVAHNGDSAMRAITLVSVQTHVHPDRSWRAKRLYRDIADWLHARDPRKARAFVEAMPEGKARATIERRHAGEPL